MAWYKYQLDPEEEREIPESNVKFILLKPWQWKVVRLLRMTTAQEREELAVRTVYYTFLVSGFSFLFLPLVWMVTVGTAQILVNPSEVVISSDILLQIFVGGGLLVYAAYQLCPPEEDHIWSRFFRLGSWLFRVPRWIFSKAVIYFRKTQNK